MIGVVGLSHQRCRIARPGITRDSEGEPDQSETTLVTSAPCRFDRAVPRTFSNLVSGPLRSEQVVGRLYIDATVKGDDDKPLKVKYKDKIWVEGEGPFEIFYLNPVQGLDYFDHYELDLINIEDR